MEQDILLNIKGKIGKITLNKPKKLNVLNLGITTQLRKYLQDCLENPEVAVVVIEGAGEKAFSAGGDLVTMKEAYEKDGVDATVDILKSEYLSGEMVKNYPKFIISYMDGITMGGSAGIVIGSDFRVATERTRWAMPETKMGLFADVALSYYFSRMKYEMGNYIALSSKIISADDCLFVDIADIKISSEFYQNWLEDLEKLLEEKDFSKFNKENIKKEIQNIFKKYELKKEEGFLEKNKDEIQKYFSKNTLEEIYEELEKNSASSELAKNILKDFSRNSPISMKVTKELLKRAKNMTLKECVDLDPILARNFMSAKDVYAGIETILIEKTGEIPNWEIKDIRDVSAELVNSYFE